MGRKLEELDRTELLRFMARNTVTIDGCWFRQLEKERAFPNIPVKKLDW